MDHLRGIFFENDVPNIILESSASKLVDVHQVYVAKKTTETVEIRSWKDKKVAPRKAIE